jgi:hypothetical protein
LEIYVRPFPAVNGGHRRMSTGGGTSPLWAQRAGVVYVAIRRADAWAWAQPAWVATLPAKLIKGERLWVAAAAATFRATASGFDDQAESGSDQATAPTGIIVVQNGRS